MSSQGRRAGLRESPPSEARPGGGSPRVAMAGVRSSWNRDPPAETVGDFPGSPPVGGRDRDYAGRKGRRGPGDEDRHPLVAGAAVPAVRGARPARGRRPVQVAALRVLLQRRLPLQERLLTRLPGGACAYTPPGRPPIDPRVATATDHRPTTGPD